MTGPAPVSVGQRAPLWFVVGLALGAAILLIGSQLSAVLSGPQTLETGRLVILSGRDDSQDGQRQKLVDEWNVLHPEQQADIRELSPLADAQHAEMLARAQDGDASVDVYNLDVTWTAEFADAGYIRSLDQARVSTAGFLPGPLATCRYRSRLWALPWNTDVGLLYYNTDLLAQYRLPGRAPVSWDELVDYARAVPPAADGTPPEERTVGYVGQLADYEGLTVTALEAVWGAGGAVVDGTERVLPTPTDIVAVRNGLNQLRDLDPHLPELDETRSLTQFRTGHALFMRNWPVANRSLAAVAKDGRRVDYAVTALPGGPAALGGQNLAVSARTRHPNAARALVEFLTDERSEQILLERGGLPATRDVVYADPKYAVEGTFDHELKQALAAARPRPALAHYTEFSRAFRSSIGPYLAGTDKQLAEDVLRTRLEAAVAGRPPPG